MTTQPLKAANLKPGDKIQWRNTEQALPVVAVTTTGNTTVLTLQGDGGKFPWTVKANYSVRRVVEAKVIPLVSPYDADGNSPLRDSITVAQAAQKAG